jgi:dipeptidyl aminopeptidase/acylaminoacyl peptidase
VQAVVNLYGPVDLTTDHAHNHDLVKKFLGKPYEEAPDLYERASPLRYVTEDDPPTLILHGTIDDLVPIGQADTLSKALSEVGVAHRYERLEGWPHGMDLAQNVNDYCVRRMAEFLDKHLARNK